METKSGIKQKQVSANLNSAAIGNDEVKRLTANRRLLRRMDPEEPDLD